MQIATNFSGRIPELDGLRGLAILLVLILHYFVVLVPAEFGSPLAYLLACLRLTWTGVDLFFVLSGFLIGGILLDNRESPNYFKTFYVRRICRIFPLYYANILLFLVALALGGAILSPWLFDNALPLFSYITFTQNFSLAHAGKVGAFWLAPTWSLAVEEQFYLVLPLIVRFTNRRKLPYVLLGMILAAPLLRLALLNLSSTGGFTAAVIMPTRADTLMLGVLIAYLIRVPGMLGRIAAHRMSLYVLLALLGTGMGILTVAGYGAETKILAIPGYTWIALFYGTLLLVGITQQESIFGTIMRNRILRGLGNISYCVYLIHLPVLGVLHAWLFGKSPEITSLAQAAVTVGALLTTVVVAKVSWAYFEKPILRIGHSYS